MAFDPVTMALLMAGSSAVKGIGQGISSFQQAEGIMGEEEKRMLRRLQREQEMNALGFSDSEIGDLTRQYRNPQQAIAKAQADQLAMGMAASGVGGPADAFRMALAQQDQQNRMNAEIADKISAMNVAEKQREEQMLLSLSRQEAAQEAAKKAVLVELQNQLHKHNFFQNRLIIKKVLMHNNLRCNNSILIN